MSPTDDKWWLLAGAGMTALGLSWVIVVGAAVGAIATVFLAKGEAIRVRAANAALGMLLALVATPAAGAYLEVKPLVNGILALVIALWGMSVVREVNEWVKAGGIKSLLAGLLDKLPKGGS